MKKFIIAVVAIAVGFVQANAMSHERAQAEALFLTDKMAYELNLTNAQYDAVYEINYDYFVSLVGTSDILGIFWNRRERELEWVLTSWQYRHYLATTYFYKPVGVYDNVIRFAIYDKYARDRYYKPVRKVHKNYHGGHGYKAPAHHNDKGHGLAHNGHHGNLAPAPKPNGNHNPGKVAPNNGGNKPNGNTTPKVKPNNGGNHNGANVGGNTSKPRTGGSAARTSATPRASKNAPEGRRTSSAVRK